MSAAVVCNDFAAKPGVRALPWQRQQLLIASTLCESKSVHDHACICNVSSRRSQPSVDNALLVAGQGDRVSA